MKQLLLLVLMLSSILVSAQTSQSKRADTTTRAEIRLPTPAGAMTMEVISDTIHRELAEQINKLAAHLKTKNAGASVVLYCLVSSMYMRKEQEMAETCIHFMGELLSKQK